MTENELQILIRIKEDLDGLRKTQAALAEAKSSAGAFGNSLDNAGISTKNLQRANVLMAGALSGNVVSAVGAVRGAFVSLMGPMGLALAAVAAIGTKLYSVWQESRAAEAAKEAADAADKYQWSLNRAKEAAADLSKASADAFAAALKTARDYFEEANKQLERQFNNTQKIAKANLDLERTKIRNDPTLTEQQKIIAEQKLLNNFETQNLQLKIQLLTEQKTLAEKSKAAADAALAAANAQLEAAKAKSADKSAWIDTVEVARLETLKKTAESELAALQSAIRSSFVADFDGATDMRSKAEQAADSEKFKRLKQQIADAQRDLARANSSEAAEENNKLVAKEIDLVGEMIKKRAQLVAAGGLTEDEKARLEAEIQRLKNIIAKLQPPDAPEPAPKTAYENRRQSYEDARQPGGQLMDYQGPLVGIMDAADQLGSAGDAIADLFSGTILDAVNAVSEGIYGWATGTQSFGDALRTLGDSIFKELLNTIIRIGVQWLINTILVKTGIISIGAVEDQQRQQQTAKTQAAQAATLPGATANAAATGISSWGVALAFGALAIAMILAAAGAFATGGPVTGKKQLAWLNDGDDGPEYVLRGAAHAKYGTDFLNSLNAGTYDPNIAAQAMAEAPVASASSPAAALAQARGNAPARAGQSGAAALAAAMPKQNAPAAPNQYFLFDEGELRQRMYESGDFEASVTRVLKAKGYRT